MSTSKVPGGAETRCDIAGCNASHFQETFGPLPAGWTDADPPKPARLPAPLLPGAPGEGRLAARAGAAARALAPRASEDVVVTLALGPLAGDEAQSADVADDGSVAEGHGGSFG